jgi:peptidoglycan/xylan/chitin deacetylase (PgdA/CDA1 family)
MTHRRHDGLEEAEARAELDDGLAAIAAAGIARPRWYRPPYGGSSPALARFCEELDLGLAYWSTWGQDWERIPARRIARLVLRGLDDGAVILLHDSPLYAEREDAGPTIEAIAPIAAAAAEKQLRLRTLSSALDAGRS